MKKSNSKRPKLYLSGLVAVFLVLIIPLLFTLYRPSPTVKPAEKLSHHAYEMQQEELTKQLKHAGLKATFSYVRQQLKSNPAFARECHPLLHHLGRTAFAQLGGFQAALVDADEICNSGYIHGVIEGNFAAAENVDQALAASCPKSAEENFKQWQCFHGVGHGVMYSLQKDHGKSIEICERLATPFAVGACVNGVFMERFIVVSHMGGADAPSPLTDMALCKNQKQLYKADCYTYAPTAYLERNTNRYDDAVDWCNKAESDFVATCVSGVAAQAMKDNITKPEFAADLCRRVASGYSNACVFGSVGIFINHYASSDRALPLCTKEFGSFKQTCDNVISNKKTTLQI